MASRTLVIAEVGACHDGSLKNALGLIEDAKYAGADVVKFQFWSLAKRMADRRKAPEYLDIYERYRVPWRWLHPLRDYANEKGLRFMCSVYLPEDVCMVDPCVDMLKVSSFEANDHELWMALFTAKNPITVSLGMGAVIPTADGTFLHCVSAYPAQIDTLQLGQIRARGLDGFSDHSGQMHVGALAVAAGARVIEAHLKGECTHGKNPDAGPHALSPGEFHAYVGNIRDAEAAMAYSDEPNPAEAEMSKYRVGV